LLGIGSRAGWSARGRRRPHAPAKSASFSTVFQLRPVARVASVFSISALVSFERPMPSE
jgi:hypothetical protein